MLKLNKQLGTCKWEVWDRHDCGQSFSALREPRSHTVTTDSPLVGQPHQAFYIEAPQLGVLKCEAYESGDDDVDSAVVKQLGE